MGRLLGWKGFQYGLRAFAHANLTNSEYWLVGDGPIADDLKQLVRELGIEDKVKFWGRVRRLRALELLSQSHVLVHPSLRDSGGWVCLESMAARCPVICLNLGGPAVQVTNETGFVVDAISPPQVVEDISSAMTAYATNPELVQKHGDAGLTRVENYFTWDKKVEFLSAVYRASDAN